MYRKLSFMLYTLGCFAAIGACVIVNLAVSGGLTWAIYVIYSVPFGWAAGAPLWLKNWWGRAVPLSLAAVSVLALPYLYLLAGQTGGGWFMPLGLPCGIIGVVTLWAVYCLFRFAKIGLFYKLALTVLFAGAAVGPAVNWFAHRFAGRPAGALDTFINIFASILTAAVLAIIGYMKTARGRGAR